MDIKGAVAIVTGASSGIGEATSRLLVQKGAKVVLVARSKDKLEKLEKELPDSLAIAADMTHEDEIKRMVQKVKAHFGIIDMLINVAGRGYDAPLEYTNLDTLKKIFELDVVGPVCAMQQVIPLMRKQRHGVIVNVSSGTALMVLANMGGYAGLKQALAKMTLTAREELKKDNIVVSVVYPYITDTNFERNTIKDIPHEEDYDDNGFTPPPADSAKFAAEKILEAVTSGKAEVFAHEWMQKGR